MGCKVSNFRNRETTPNFVQRAIDLISGKGKRPIYFYVNDYYHVQIDKGFPQIIKINDEEIYQKGLNYYKGVCERIFFEIFFNLDETEIEIKMTHIDKFKKNKFTFRKSV